MAMIEIARKELRLRRVSTVMVVCVCSLLLLGAAAALPRSYTASALLLFDEVAAGEQSIAQRVRSRLHAGPQAAQVSSEPNGNELLVRFRADSPGQALEGINSLLAGVVQEEVEILRAELRAREQELQTQLRVAVARVERAETRLDEAMERLPEGGESALGARIGQLQGEHESLGLDLRGIGELIRKVSARRESNERAIAALQPALEAPEATAREIARLRARLDAARNAGVLDPAAIEDLEISIARLDVEHMALLEQQADARARIDQQLAPLGQQLAARIATLRDERAVKERRRAEVATLLEQARAQSSTLVQGNQALRELQREYDDAVAMKRQLDVRLQAVQLDLAVRTTPAALDFETVRSATLPSGPDGVPSWIYALAALGGGVLVGLVRLLGRIAVDDKVRLAETIVIEAEVPVLAVIQDYRPLRMMGAVRWPVVAVTLFAAATLAAHVLFVLLLG